MPKGVPNKRYTPEFKKLVVETMLNEKLSYSNLVSYTISDRPVLSMVTTMLDKALAKIPDNTNLILHSDQCWQYQHSSINGCSERKASGRA